MKKEKFGVTTMGIKAPIIREGDDLVEIVTNCVINAMEVPASSFSYEESYTKLKDKDIIGITESVVARAQGDYVTIDEIAEWIIKRFGPSCEIIIDSPIYSRNRFSMILKGIARAAKKLYFVMPPFDEVGNPSGINPWTGVDIQKYYKDICENENCETVFGNSLFETTKSISNHDINNRKYIYCGLHDFKEWKKEHGNATNITLADICSDKCEYGLLGSNKATEEKLKLFPNKEKAQKLVEDIQKRIFEKTNKTVYVCVYGDGCFVDPVAYIWEFADPVTMPAYTNPEVFESSPNEIKVKYLADNKYGNLSGKELDEAIAKEIALHKGKDLKGSMTSEGTTPRLYRDLIASLMDLTSGSGMRATPFILIQNYFQ